MPEIKGRTGDRKSASLEVVDMEIFVSIRSGFLGRNISMLSIPFMDVNHVESRTEEHPYPDALELILDYTGGVLEFFSDNKEPLSQVVEEISDYLRLRAERLEENMESFGVARENNTALIMVNLEFFDALMRLVVELHGSVQWDRVEPLFHQVEMILIDKICVQELDSSSLSVESLRTGVERRRPPVVKVEVFDLLTMLSVDADLRSQRSIQWFPSELHRLFSQAMMTLWNHEVAEISDVNPFDSPEDAQAVFDTLRLEVEKYTDAQPMAPLNLLEYEFHINRDALFSWVEVLQLARFNPELE